MFFRVLVASRFFWTTIHMHLELDFHGITTPIFSGFKGEENKHNKKNRAHWCIEDYQEAHGFHQYMIGNYRCMWISEAKDRTVSKDPNLNALSRHTSFPLSLSHAHAHKHARDLIIEKRGPARTRIPCTSDRPQSFIASMPPNSSSHYIFISPLHYCFHYPSKIG